MRRLLLVAFVALIVGFFAWDFCITRSFGYYPAIQDRNALLSDCRSLIQRFPKNANIPKENWPASIMTFKPKGVSTGTDSIDIFISSGGIGPSYGLLIFLGTPDQSIIKQYFFTREYAKGIYFWQSQT